jgi:transposase
MAKAYGDDLRRKFLAAYDRGDGTLEELAEDFSVSLGWAKKISATRSRSGRIERVVHRPGRKAMVGDEQRKLLQAWLAAEPGLTLAELQLRLEREAGVKVSLVCIWQWMRRLGLRLKRSHTTRRNVPRPIVATGVRTMAAMSGQSSLSA